MLKHQLVRVCLKKIFLIIHSTTERDAKQTFRFLCRLRRSHNMTRHYHKGYVHRDFESDEEIPFRPDGNDPQLDSYGMVQRVRARGGLFMRQTAVRKYLPIEADPSESEEAARQRIRREAAILNRARHAHVVQLIMTYFYRSNFVIIMDHAERNLQYFLKRKKDKIRPCWFGCLIGVMAHIHELGIRHRDIKPENILIKGDKILLADFGISSMFSGSTVVTQNRSTPSSRTIAYCAPEVEMQFTTAGRSADIFSLGAVLLEMLLALCEPEMFAELQRQLGPEKEKSYARHIDEVHVWMTRDSVRGRFSDDDWKSGIFRICREMMQKEQSRRPKAADLLSWWQWQRQSPLSPRGGCDCLPPPSESEYSEVDKINESLLEAYQRGHRVMVKFWEIKGAIIGDGNSLVAASRGRLWDIVRGLLENGAKADAKDADGRTTLHFVASAGHLDLARDLLEQGANCEAEDRRNKTALRFAARNACMDIVLLLVRSKFDPRHLQEQDIKQEHVGFPVQDSDARNELIRLLYENSPEEATRAAMQKYRNEIMQGLVERGPDIDAPDPYEDTLPTEGSVGYKEEVVLKLLLNRPCNVAGREDARKMLLVASMQGQEAVVRLLLEGNVSIEGRDEDQRTPLLRAAMYGHARIVKRLLDKADEMKEMYPYGEVPTSQSNPIEAKDASGQTPLSRAAKGGHKEAVEILIDRGADVDAVDKLGETPLAKAAAEGHAAVVELLIDGGATIDARDANEETPLMKAAADGHRDVVELLVYRGARVSAKDADGQTPISKAYYGFCKEGAKKGCKKGCRKCCRDITMWLVAVHAGALWESAGIVSCIILLGALGAAVTWRWHLEGSIGALSGTPWA